MGDARQVGCGLPLTEATRDGDEEVRNEAAEALEVLEKMMAQEESGQDQD